MAHEVETMFYTGDKPWHGLGIELPNAPSIDEAIVHAGLNWEVEKRAVFCQPKGLGDWTVAPAYANVRMSDYSILGVVGEQYKPLQNAEAFNWFQPWVDTGEVLLECAGSLREGKKVWILARVKDAEADIGVNDPIKQYILLSNSHDGTTKVALGFTPIRVVCMNTLRQAVNDKESKLIRIKHTQKVQENLQYIRETMDLIRRQFVMTVEQYQFLQSRQIDMNQAKVYFSKVFEVKEGREDDSRVMPKLTYLLENGKGAKEAGMTYWGAYNAVNGYLNWFRSKDNNLTVDALWFGDSRAIDARAYDTAIDMAQAA